VEGLTGRFRKGPRSRTPISGNQGPPRQRVCPGSVNLDKVGIITDLNDKHLHQMEALKQSCDPISVANQTNAHMQLLSIIALRNSAKHAAERFTSSLPYSAPTARDTIEKNHVLACLHLVRRPAAIRCSHFLKTNALDIYDNAIRGLIAGKCAIPKLLSCLH
jgi:hypothetical protein